ncbi:MAG: gamma-glutamyltransferase family protein [Candidatus Atribacteria bacterium]|nr:MAG: gamma-glutamyltransferase family protein [Candidatus Atribacteria bacterium]
MLLISMAGLAMDPHGEYAMRPMARGTHFAVVSNNPLSTQAGEMILIQGGNAFDAVVAVQAALGVVEPSHSGIGGENYVLAKPANEDKVTAIDGGGTAASGATIEWYLANDYLTIPTNGIYSTAVPGTFDSWVVTLDKWGTMSLAEVLQPAIELAEEGYPVSDLMSQRWISGQENLSKYPSTAKLYYPNGKALQPGEIFINKDLANTMKRLVEAEQKALAAGKSRSEALMAARDRFYKGDIAQEFIAFTKSMDGLFEQKDMTDYHALVQEPATINYRGYDVYKVPSANQGPAELFALNIMEGFDVRFLEFNSAQYIHAAIEALNLAYADREAYLGDMEFIEIPMNGLLSKEYAAERRALINPDARLQEWLSGDPFKYDVPKYKYTGYPYDYLDSSKTSSLNRALTIPSFYVAKVDTAEDKASAAAQEADYELLGGYTSYAAVVDAEGNAVSSTPSLHSGFGSRIVIEGLGFPLHCRGDYFVLEEGHANALVPGKRPRNTITPSMVLKDGKPFLAYGTPCGDCQPQVLMQILMNIIDFGMNVQDAIEAPHFTSSCLPGSSGAHTSTPGRISVEGRVSADVVKALEAKGWDVNVSADYNSGFGGANAIMVEPNGSLTAGSDPRREGYAIAW